MSKPTQEARQSVATKCDNARQELVNFVVAFQQRHDLTHAELFRVLAECSKAAAGWAIRSQGVPSAPTVEQPERGLDAQSFWFGVVCAILGLLIGLFA